MRTGRPKTPLMINDMERAQLSGIARSRSMPAVLVLRAKIVLACECEANNQAVAANLDLSPHIVGKWRQRFVAKRLQGLYDEVAIGTAADGQGRGRGRADQQDARNQTRGSNPLERALHGCGDGTFQKHRASTVSALRLAAASQPQLQDFPRSLLRRQAARHRRPLSQPAGQGAGLLRR